MATLTDPANELAQLAVTLSGNDNKPAHVHLADMFGVEKSSTEFFALIHTILERTEVVIRAVSRSEWEPAQKASAVDDLNGFASAFNVRNLNTVWNTSQNVGPTLMKDHGRVITYMSEMVRKQVAYPKFDEDERAELLELIEDYGRSLREDEDISPFVRNAILDSLERFQFSLRHLEWGGSGLCIESFRALAEAYRWMNEQQSAADFDSKAALDGLLSILRSAKEKIDTAKGWSEAGGIVLKGYNIATSAITPLMIAHQASGG